MKRRKAKSITRIWKRIEADEPDISTERLLEMTSQEASRLFGHWIDNADVCEALAQTREFKEVES